MRSDYFTKPQPVTALSNVCPYAAHYKIYRQLLMLVDPDFFTLKLFLMLRKSSGLHLKTSFKICKLMLHTGTWKLKRLAAIVYCMIEIERGMIKIYHYVCDINTALCGKNVALFVKIEECAINRALRDKFLAYTIKIRNCTLTFVHCRRQGVIPRHLTQNNLV